MSSIALSHRNRKVLRRIEKKLLEKCMRPFVRWYLSKPRRYHFEGIDINVQSGVFHPGLFFSTKILLSYIKQLDLHKKKVLELGAGSGIISIYAAGKGAFVVASDINPDAIENIQENAKINKDLITKNYGQVEAIHSDLFDNIVGGAFDVIIINPPYYRGEAKNNSQYAWYAGRKLEYFTRLFGSLADYFHEDSTVLMILSEDAEVNEIRLAAEKENLKMTKVHETRNFLEINFIYTISGLKSPALISTA